MDCVNGLSPKELRRLVRSGQYSKPTSGVCPGYLQANMVILDKSLASDFRQFCEANKAACPVIAELPVGSPFPTTLADDADIRTDLPLYRVFKHGVLVEEVSDISHVWNDNLVVFLIGCSFSFESHLQNADVPVRNIEQQKNVSMFMTNIQCTAVGPFHCQLVVSYRPIPADLVATAIDVTKSCGAAHGPPVHTGNPLHIGIADLSKPDFGDPVRAHEGDVPVFWACGVTSTLGALSAKSELVITHAPGHMFVTDKQDLTSSTI